MRTLPAAGHSPDMIAPLVGWDAIARATPYAADTLRKLWRRRLECAGVVAYHKVGRPPRSRPHAYAAALERFFSGVAHE